MSTERATGNQSTGPTDDEPQTQLTQLLRRVEALEAENEQLHSKLEATREQHREDRHALAHENHEFRERTRKNERAVEHAYNQIDELHNEVTECQERAEQAEAERDELREQVENDEKTVVATDGGGNSALEPRVNADKELHERVDHVEDETSDNSARLDALSKGVTYAKEQIEKLEEKSESRSREDGDLENTLPIQQTTRIWKVGGTIKTNKTEHAAALWSDFFDRCKKGNGIFYLDTSRARSILREHFRDEEDHTGLTEGSSAHVRNIVHRAMDALVDLGGNLVTKRTIKSGRSALVINKEEFDDFCETIGAVANDATGGEKETVTEAV